MRRLFRKKEPREFSCRHCGKLFTWKHKLRYCSHRCMLLSRGSIKTCKQCKKQYQAPPSRRILFCSDPCYRQYEQARNKPKSCRHCGQLFVKRDLATTRKTKFCSRPCHQQYSRGVNNPLYRGERKADRGITWKERSTAARQRDQECQSLIHSPTKNPARKERLSVDHIVSYAILKKYCPLLDANDLRNLICLCRSCHAFKTSSAEVRFVRGDITGFIQQMNRIVPIERVKEALALYGFYREALVG